MRGMIAPIPTQLPDAEKLGKVTISYDHQNCLRVHCEGFVWSNKSSCRESAMQSMTWARDVLNAAIEIDHLAPGGSIVTSVD